MTPILELKNVSAGYDHEVILHQVNLKIYEHDFLGIIGPNGGGKTTLLKVILGLLKPYSGEVIYPVSRQNLFGYLPQNSRFDQRFPIDVTEVVLSGLMSEKGLYKSYTRAEKQKAWDLLDQYGMGAYIESTDRRFIGRTDATGIPLQGDHCVSPHPDPRRTDDLCRQ